MLDDEINAFKESIKIGEQKPNITAPAFALDKSDVDGKLTLLKCFSSHTENLTGFKQIGVFTLQ